MATTHGRNYKSSMTLQWKKEPTSKFRYLTLDVFFYLFLCWFYRYIEFTEQSSKLNDLNNYSRLLERCKMIGYKVTKVVYRGYFAGDKLQNLHENSAQKRTNLKIQVLNKYFAKFYDLGVVCICPWQFLTQIYLKTSLIKTGFGDICI